ncbi:MAG: DUF4118 domain-containing protein [Syntrophobacteraceae bacterium]
MVWDRTNRPVWLRCTVGILVAILAAAIRWQFPGSLEVRSAFLTFYPAVVVAALYGGFSAGLAATFVSAALPDLLKCRKTREKGWLEICTTASDRRLPH